MSFYFLLPVFIVLLIGFIIYRSFGGVFKQMRNSKMLAQTGTLAMADVLAVSQTGTTVNQVPEMNLTLQLENPDGTTRKVNIKQLVDLGSIPRAGDRVYVLVDPQNPGNVVLSPVPTGSGMKIKLVDDSGKQTGTMDMSSPQAMDYMSLPADLRERGKPGVAKIVAVEQAADNLSKLTLDLDNIGQPLKRVTITQHISGYAPAPGTRLYYIYDPQHPDHMQLAPASMTQGQTLGVGSNRLDPLVLGPQLLQVGAKATGKVLSAENMAMVNPGLAAQGFSKWKLGLQVTPQDSLTPAYQAELTTSLSSKEKADRIAHAGAEVPLRYDPLDLQTIGIDSIAMGYPDPYAAVMTAFNSQLANY